MAKITVCERVGFLKEFFQEIEAGRTLWLLTEILDSTLSLCLPIRIGIRSKQVEKLKFFPRKFQYTGQKYRKL
jgi:hypothetical protein